jgi:carbamoyl-phosphate synthase large subunit
MWIVGSDMSRRHLEWPDVDVAYEAPWCRDDSYIDFLNDVIAREGIGFVHPQPDPEVRAISEHRGGLNARVLLPDHATVLLLQDKHVSGERWAAAGISSTPSLLVNDRADLEFAAAVLGLPFWLRATEGAGGTGSTPVDDLEVATHWMAYWRLRGRSWSWVAQELLPGANLAFTSLWYEGELIASQARERLEYIYPYLAPSGVTGTPVDAVTCNRADVNDVATRAVLAVDPRATGLFCVDLKEDTSGLPRPTEINCGRFFTTSYFYTAAGVNFPELYVALAFGDSRPQVPKYNALAPGQHWLRHMDCPAVLRTEEQLRAHPLRRTAG